MDVPPLPSVDLETIVELDESDLRALTGARIFVTGGTGFVGTWLLAALHHADRRLALDLDVRVLTRDAARFGTTQPALAAWATTIEGDVRTCPNPGTVDFAIHAATSASATLNDTQPDLMRQTIVEGMERVLDVLEPSGPIPLLFTSSGAVYGRQPLDLERIPETYSLESADIAPTNAYALGKQDAERIALAASQSGGPSLRLARLFAFVGPLLPLDAHFAIGNFIRDALAGGPIRVAGDGTAVRSYLYAADMVVQLLAILARGEVDQPYNVGSDSPISIADLARLVESTVAPGCGVDIAGLAPGALPTGAGSRYVPETRRIAAITPTTLTPLRQAVEATASWYRYAEGT